MNSRWLHAALLAALALPYFINLGVSSIWDGSEAFYAETPREMLASGDWLSPRFNFEPRVNKPPLAYWAILASYKLLGVNEFAVRLPGALAALGVVLFAWGAARTLFSPGAALVAAAVAATTPRVFILQRRLPIDMLLLFFLAGTLFFLLRATASARADARKDGEKEGEDDGMARKGRTAAWCCAYAFAALGFLTKGPVAVFVPAAALLAWAAYARKFRVSIKDMGHLYGAAVFLAIALPYYLASYRAHGWAYIAPFFLSDNLGRFASEPFGPSRGFFYYIPVWLSDFFPWSVILPVALYCLRRGRMARREGPDYGDLTASWPPEGRPAESRLKNPAFGLPLFWCLGTFLVFSFSKNKQEYYIAPMYPAGAVLLAGLVGLFDRWRARKRPARAATRVERQILRPWNWVFGFLALLLFFSALVLPYVLDLLLPDVGFSLRFGPSCILVGGTALMVRNALRKDFHRGLAALSFSLWSMFFCGALVYVPALESFRPVKDFCRRIEVEAAAARDAGFEAGYFRTAFPSMTFYLKRRIFEEDDRDRMLKRLQSPRRVYCVLEGRDYERFRKQVPTLRVLERRARFSVRFRQLFSEERRADRDLLLISN